MIKTASGYNHDDLPGRFFEKKADLIRALASKKVAWTGGYKPGQPIPGSKMFMGKCMACDKPIAIKSKIRAMEGSGLCKACMDRRGMQRVESPDRAGTHPVRPRKEIERDLALEGKLEREDKFEHTFFASTKAPEKVAKKVKEKD